MPRLIPQLFNLIPPKQKKASKSLDLKAYSLKLADRTGLEPATSAVTGRHSNQLNYRSLPTREISLI